MGDVEGQMVEAVKRFVVEIHPKTGDYSVVDRETGALLDISDCARLLNELVARHSRRNVVA